MSTMSPQDVRAGLPRRFTTNALPTLSPIGQQRMQAVGDYAVSDLHILRDVRAAARTLRDVRAAAAYGDGGGGGGAGTTVRMDGIGFQGSTSSGDMIGTITSRPLNGGPLRAQSHWVQYPGGEELLWMAEDEEDVQDGEVLVIYVIYKRRLTNSEQSAGYARRLPPVSLPPPSVAHSCSDSSQSSVFGAQAYRHDSTDADHHQSEIQMQRYENLLATQRQLQAELEAFDPAVRTVVENGRRHEESIAQMMASSDAASPPEYGNAFPSSLSKPHRYSAASMTSPPGLTSRSNGSSVQLTSPSAGFVRPYTSGGTTNIPSHSVPGSRRQSDDEDEDDFLWNYDSAIRRSAAK